MTMTINSLAVPAILRCSFWATFDFYMIYAPKFIPVLVFFFHEQLLQLMFWKINNYCCYQFICHWFSSIKSKDNLPELQVLSLDSLFNLTIGPKPKDIQFAVMYSKSSVNCVFVSALKASVYHHFIHIACSHMYRRAHCSLSCTSAAEFQSHDCKLKGFPFSSSKSAS